MKMLWRIVAAIARFVVELALLAVGVGGLLMSWCGGVYTFHAIRDLANLDKPGTQPLPAVSAVCGLVGLLLLWGTAKIWRWFHRPPGG